jgi:hypothetical protein
MDSSNSLSHSSQLNYYLNEVDKLRDEEREKKRHQKKSNRDARKLL